MSIIIEPETSMGELLDFADTINNIKNLSNNLSDSPDIKIADIYGFCKEIYSLDKYIKNKNLKDENNEKIKEFLTRPIIDKPKKNVMQDNIKIIINETQKEKKKAEKKIMLKEWMIANKGKKRVKSLDQKIIYSCEDYVQYVGIVPIVEKTINAKNVKVVNENIL